LKLKKKIISFQFISVLKRKRKLIRHYRGERDERRGNPILKKQVATANKFASQ